MERKLAFTLAEVLIALTIIGVTLGITIPVINNQRPDKDAIMFKKAAMTIQTAFGIATDDTDILYCGGTWKNCEKANLCTKIADNINTSGKVSCSGSAASSYDDPNFVSTDGTRYWGFEGNFTTDEKVVYADRKLSPGEIDRLSKKRDDKHANPGLKIVLKANGKSYVPPNNNEYDYETKLLEQTINSAKGAGKI